MDKVIEKKLRLGDKGTKDTIEIMVSFAREYADNKQIQDIAADLADYCDHCTIRKIFNYIVDKIRYTKDPDYIELVKSPKHTVLGNKNYGDCDDLSVALASILLASGFDVLYKTIAWRPENPKQFSHVYVMVKLNNGWIPLDPTMGKTGFGNEVKKIIREKYWKI